MNEETGLSSFREILKQERRANSLTQAELARKIGVDTSHIASIEIGRRKPSADLVARIAEALNLDARDLLLLARPETRAFIRVKQSAVQKENDPGQAWRKILEDRAMLRRYQVSERELKALKQLNLLGYALSKREFLTIVTLLRRQPHEAD